MSQELNKGYRGAGGWIERGFVVTRQKIGTDSPGDQGNGKNDAEAQPNLMPVFKVSGNPTCGYHGNQHHHHIRGHPFAKIAAAFSFRHEVTHHTVEAGCTQMTRNKHAGGEPDGDGGTMLWKKEREPE